LAVHRQLDVELQWSLIDLVDGKVAWKTAIVTDAVAGIGAAIVKKFAKARINVTPPDHQVDWLRKLQKDIEYSSKVQ
jgi:NADP-dependent 3-hydroxy acid dehydrogenase YdfG